MRFLNYLGVLLLCFILSTFMAGTIELAFGFSLSRLSFFLSWIFFFIFFYFFISRKKEISIKVQLVLLLLFSVILSFSFCISTYFLDFSFDGQWYHQNAILLLNNGWNPYYSLPIANKDTIAMDEDYINHYAKASWIIEGVWYKFFSFIQTSKADHIILAFSTFFICSNKIYCWFGLNKKQSILFAALLCFSPVVVGQAFSFYVDGLLASCLILLILFLIDLAKNDTDLGDLVILCLLFGFTVNLKFTALIYALIFVGFTIIWIFFNKKSKWLFKIIYLCVIIMVGTLFFGYPTYVRNAISKGHPFYPLMGAKNYGQRIAEVQYPINFFGKNRFEKYFLSTFSESVYTSQDQFPSVKKKLFKLPNLTEDLKHFKNHQPVAMSPLGPFNGEFVVLLIPLVIALFWIVRKKWFYFVFFSIFFSIIVQPEFWNFRYSPQVWFLYFIILLFSFVFLSKIYKYYVLILSLLISFSFGFCHYAYFSCASSFTSGLRSEMSELKNKKIIIKPHWLNSALIRADEFNLNYRIATDKDTNFIFKPFKGDYVTKCLYAVEK
jgi:hypothetical protein